MKKHRWLSGILQKSLGRRRSARHSVPSARIESLEARSLLTVQGISLADPANLGDTANGESGIGGRSVSNDGRYAVVLSHSPNLVQGQIDRAGVDAFLLDRQTGEISLVSHQAGSSVATAGSVIQAVISGNGQYVAFASSATDLVTGQTDSNGDTDVFLYDRVTGSIVLVSHAVGSLTTAGNEGSGFDNLSLSADGRYVCYGSQATNLVSGQSDASGTIDAFVFDRTTGTSALVSHASSSATTAGDFGGSGAKISANGSVIGFTSSSTNLVSGLNDANGTNSDVFLYAVGSGTITLASRTAASANTTGNAFSFFGDLSSDGQFVVFSSRADNLVNGFVDANDPNINFNQNDDLYLFSGGANVLVSHAAGLPTTGGNAETNYEPRISADGNWIVFGSNATNLISGQNDQNGSIDLFLYNRASQTSTLVSGANGSATTTGNAFTGISTISNDGQKIAFQSSAFVADSGNL
ncbi:MAG: PD40 domain-containing protein, partial [Fuerstia sp.]|nr:PD40 domain-containing protein [Fuerstiella sp.]